MMSEAPGILVPSGDAVAPRIILFHPKARVTTHTITPAAQKNFALSNVSLLAVYPRNCGGEFERLLFVDRAASSGKTDAGAACFRDFDKLLRGKALANDEPEIPAVVAV